MLLHDLVAVLLGGGKRLLLAPMDAVAEVLAIDHAATLNGNQPPMGTTGLIIDTTNSIYRLSSHAFFSRDLYCR